MKPLQIVCLISIILLIPFKANGSPELIFETHYVFDPPPPPYFPPRPEPVELMVDVTNQLGKFSYMFEELKKRIVSLLLVFALCSDVIFLK